MNPLYAVFFATLAGCTTLILESPNILDGNKLLFIVFDFVCISYLFLFNSWFRNQILFPLISKTRKD